MKLFEQKQLGGSVSIFDRDPNGEDAVNRQVMVTFANDEGGEVAYAVFLRGLSSMPQASLYDSTAGRYVQGSLAQLLGREA